MTMKSPFESTIDLDLAKVAELLGQNQLLKPDMFSNRVRHVKVVADVLEFGKADPMEAGDIWNVAPQAVFRVEGLAIAGSGMLKAVNIGSENQLAHPCPVQLFHSKMKLGIVSALLHEHWGDSEARESLAEVLKTASKIQSALHLPTLVPGQVMQLVTTGDVERVIAWGVRPAEY